MPLTWLLLALIGVALVALMIQGARRQLAAAARDEADETAGDGPMFGIETAGGEVAEIPVTAKFSLLGEDDDGSLG